MEYSAGKQTSENSAIIVLDIPLIQWYMTYSIRNRDVKIAQQAKELSLYGMLVCCLFFWQYNTLETQTYPEATFQHHSAILGSYSSGSPL